MADVVVKENVLNKNMTYSPRFVLGEVPAPDYHYEPELFSHHKATKNFNQIHQDIYESVQSSKPADRKRTPKAVLAIFGIGGLFGIYKLVRRLIKK